MPNCKTMVGSTRFCHICGLRIPGNIVSFVHPLFGTVDHVVPRSKGGKNVLANRRPAHHLCNSSKGNSLELTQECIVELQNQVTSHLRRVGITTSKALLAEARSRVGFEHLNSKAYKMRLRAISHVLAMSTWEDDGGAIR